MLTIKPTTRFQKDVKRAQRRGYDMALLADIIRKLASGEALPAKNRDHALSGNYAGCRECYITPDWLLIYEVEEQQLFLYLTRTGTHSDLF
ncbi:MAG TPA: type II toxin-antitoxin system YafQ family toxin [Candidatus Desulfovibrio intestinigallinarum]|nr:type II toxin-antitoxin system YafQ family toxin [Candidatus Desulfovibrio intestinigallinarum]